MAWVEWRARPRGPTVPRRPSGALGQRGALGAAPLRFGPPAAQGGERAGLRGRPLIVAPVPRIPERTLPTARAHTTTTLASWTSGEPNERTRHYSVRGHWSPSPAAAMGRLRRL